MVAVLDKQKKPLMPCSEKRAKLMLARGRARVLRILPVFTIRLIDRLVETSSVQEIAVSIDPGSKASGVAVSRLKNRVRHALVLVELQHKRALIRKNLLQRKGFRKQRRSHLRYRAPGFNNRTRSEGWLGDSIKVEPIRELKNIKAIKRLLADKPRNLAIFVIGINTNLRASDILKITVGQVRNLVVENHFSIREKKTGKERNITVNKTVHDAIQNLLVTMPTAKDEEPLFQSRKGNTVLGVPYLNALVKEWCAEINLTGNYGSHTLRKTFGYMHRTINKTDLPTLMTMFNHSSRKQTLDYLCIQPEEIKSAYLFEL